MFGRIAKDIPPTGIVSDLNIVTADKSKRYLNPIGYCAKLTKP